MWWICFFSCCLKTVLFPDLRFVSWNWPKSEYLPEIWWFSLFSRFWLVWVRKSVISSPRWFEPRQTDKNRGLEKEKPVRMSKFLLFLPEMGDFCLFACLIGLKSATDGQITEKGQPVGKQADLGLLWPKSGKSSWYGYFERHWSADLRISFTSLHFIIYLYMVYFICCEECLK